MVISQPPIRMVDAKTKLSEGRQFYLLGLFHGHFDIKSLNEDAVSDTNEALHNINTGIGVVIPVEKIIETVNRPEMKAQRRKLIAGLRKSGEQSNNTREGIGMVVMTRQHVVVRPDLAADDDTSGIAP